MPRLDLAAVPFARVQDAVDEWTDADDQLVAGLRTQLADLQALIAEQTAELHRLRAAAALRTPPQIGHAAPGSVTWPIPAGAVYLSLTGNDSADGFTSSTPKRTGDAAVAALPASGGTIVITQSGDYLQGFTKATTKPLVIQPAPGVKATFTGSKRQTAWTALGDGTWQAPLFAQFDHTVPENYAKAVDPAYPMAGWPDRVHVDDTELDQRPTSEKPGPNQFTVDYTPRTGAPFGTVRIGTNPTGRDVQLTALALFGVFRADTVLRGLTIHRYATAIAGSAATIDLGGPVGSSVVVRLEHCLVEDCGQQSVAFRRQAVKGSGLFDCTVRGGGVVGVLGDRCRDVAVERTLVEGCNTNRWKEQPSSAGLKFGRAIGTRLRDVISRNNFGHGYWFDVSCDDTIGVNVVSTGNTGPSFSYEISRRLLLVNFRGPVTGTSGIWALDSHGVRVWNSSLDRASAFDLRFEEDARAGTVSAGENPDGLQDWRTHDIELGNFILTNAAGRAGTWRLYAGTTSTTTDTRKWFTRIGGGIWSGTSPLARFAAFKVGATQTPAKTPDELVKLMPTDVVGATVIAPFGEPTAEQVGSWSAAADPIPADVAELLDLPAGSRVLGPVLPAPVVRAA
jgi:hypothetical protein